MVFSHLPLIHIPKIPERLDMTLSQEIATLIIPRLLASEDRCERFEQNEKAYNEFAADLLPGSGLWNQFYDWRLANFGY